MPFEPRTSTARNERAEPGPESIPRFTLRPKKAAERREQMGLRTREVVSVCVVVPSYLGHSRAMGPATGVPPFARSARGSLGCTYESVHQPSGSKTGVTS